MDCERSQEGRVGRLVYTPMPVRLRSALHYGAWDRVYKLCAYTR